MLLHISAAEVLLPGFPTHVLPQHLVVCVSDTLTNSSSLRQTYWSLKIDAGLCFLQVLVHPRGKVLVCSPASSLSLPAVCRGAWHMSFN